MKTLLIARDYFPPQIGGISRWLFDVCINLPKEEVICFLSSHICRNKDIYPFKVYRSRYFSAKSSYFGEMCTLSKLFYILIKEKIKIIQFETVYVSYLALYLKNFYSCPYIIYAHGNEILSLRYSKWSKPFKALRKANKIIANSYYVKSLLKRMGIKDSKIEVIHPGVNCEKFRPNVRCDDLKEKLGLSGKKVILTVGNLVKRKGHDKVIEALPIIIKEFPNIIYLIIGKGRDEEYLKKIVEQKKVSKYVKFLGYVSDEELPKYYNLCDIFIMPSRERLDENDVEGFGIVCIEASSCAKPVIAGKSGGMDNAVVDGQTGLLVNPTSSIDIAHALIKLLKNEKYAKFLGQNGRKYVLNNLSNKIVINKIRKIFLSLTTK